MQAEEEYETTLLADSDMEGAHSLSLAQPDATAPLVQSEIPETLADIAVQKEEKRTSSASEVSSGSMNVELRCLLLEAEVQAGAKRP
eukprot:6222889-Amphidinium_carterae.1